MELVSLKAVNFQSYPRLELSLECPAVYYIVGVDSEKHTSNGAGKSAIKEAFLFGLFGKGKVKQPSLISLGADSMSVSLSVKESGKLLVVERSRTRKATSSSLKASIDGIELKGLPSEIQNQIDSFLGLDYNKFIRYNVVDKVRQTTVGEVSGGELRDMVIELFSNFTVDTVLNRLAEKQREIAEKIKINPPTHYFSQARLDHIISLKRTELSKLQSIDASLAKLSQISHRTIEKKIDSQNLLTKSLGELKELQNPPTTCSKCGAPLPVRDTAQDIDKVTKLIQKLTKRVERIKFFIDNIDAGMAKIQYFKQQASEKIVRASNLMRRLEASKTKQLAKSELLKEQVTIKKATEEVQHYYNSFILASVTSLEDELNGLLATFSDLSIKITLSKVLRSGIENFTADIKVYREDAVLDADMLSSGEVTFIGLLFKLISAKITHNLSTLWIDEGLDTLDAISRQRMIEIINNWGFYQVFIISHREDAIEGKDSYKIRVSKVEDKSTILDI